MDVKIINQKWLSLCTKIANDFDTESPDIKTVLFLIGVQELGQDYQKFKKDQKVELMHIGICSLLVSYGYYSFIGRDEEGWPHFERNSALPNLTPQEQELLVRKAIVRYFS